jgi:hypothetical protein
MRSISLKFKILSHVEILRHFCVTKEIVDVVVERRSRFRGSLNWIEGDHDVLVVRIKRLKSF